MGKDKGMYIGITPLIAASIKGNLEVVRALVAADARMDKVTNKGATPLACAASGGHMEIVKFLCESGARTDVTDEDGATPLDLANRHGHAETARLLRQDSSDEASVCSPRCHFGLVPDNRSRLQFDSREIRVNRR